MLFPYESDPKFPKGQLSAAVAARHASCGIGALYVFLRLHGQNVSYAELERALALKPEGHSMLELRDTAARFGFPCRILHFSGPLSQLGDGNIPAIVFNPQRRLWSADERLGHYYVLLSVDAKGVDYVDATSGEQFRATEEYFRRGIDGYLLEPSGQSNAWEMLEIVGGIVGCLASTLLLTQEVVRTCRLRNCR